MSTSKPSRLSASERRAVEAELRTLISKFSSANQRLIATTRRWLLKRLPTAHEIVYEYRDCFVISYSPNGHGYAGVFALRGSADGVRLYFNQGKGLPDPDKLLKGSGGLVRWIPLEDASTLKFAPVLGLFEAALVRNRVPFARTGRGPIIVRSTAAKKRQR